MKRLLLLFILLPTVLFGQMRQKAMVDAIKAAATDIQNVSAIINRYPGNTVEHIQVSDSGEYVTVVVRVHVADPGLIPALPLLPVIEIRTGTLVADSMSSVIVPIFAHPVVDPDTIAALSLLAVNTLKATATPVIIMDTVVVPPMPEIKPDIETLPLVALALLRIEDISASKLDTVSVPILPNIDPNTIDYLPLLATVEFAIELPSAGKMDTIAIPGLGTGEISVAEMHLSAEGYDLLEKLEGFSPKLYSLKDGGFTIGFGFFVPYGEGSKWNKGVTIEDAERMMRQKVPVYEDQVKQYINVPLTQEEFDALTMLAYNLGGFSKATSIVRDINTNVDFAKLQKDWMRFVHSKAPAVMKGLMNRRKDELQVRYESNYQPEREIQVLINRR